MAKKRCGFPYCKKHEKLLLKLLKITQKRMPGDICFSHVNETFCLKSWLCGCVFWMAGFWKWFYVGLGWPSFCNYEWKYRVLLSKNRGRTFFGCSLSCFLSFFHVSWCKMSFFRSFWRESFSFFTFFWEGLFFDF